MTPVQNHIIQKQIIEVTFPSGKNANALQDRIRNIYYEKIIPFLDTLFSGFIKDDIIIRLDKLDIDLGHINEDDLEKQLTEKIIVAVRHQLESSLQFDVKDSRNVQLIPGGQSVINGFLYFLSQGHFPWWCGINDLTVLESAVTKQYKTDIGLPAKLLQLLNTDEYATRRLNFQFSKSFRAFIVEKIFASQDITTRVLINELLLQPGEATTTKADVQRSGEKSEIPGNVGRDKTVSTPRENAEERRSNKKDVKVNIDESPPESSNVKQNEQQVNNDLEEHNDQPATLESSPLTPRAEEKTEPGDERSKRESSKKQDKISVDESASVRQKNKVQQTGDVSSKERADPATGELKNENKTGTEADLIMDQKHAEKKLYGDKAPQRKVKKEVDKETIYLELAGLVILHPFIIEFFAGLKLTRNNQFIGEASRQKAVHLLGYIATASTEIEEHLLILPKLLCGMELIAPIEKEIIITDEERHEVTDLLTTVISYWKAIKNTSPDGLRGSFLLRAGKLSPREGGWQLDVERKTWDILLGKLPWGISIIKLPWMQEILFVNWQ